MRFSIILVVIGLCLCRAENCGILKHDDWPWSVSIFYGTKSTVLCQGSLLSSKHILTGKWEDKDRKNSHVTLAEFSFHFSKLVIA